MRPYELQRIFTYHAPHGDQAQRYEQLRAGGLELADKINRLAPDSAEKTTAIRRVQEAVMYANAAIACNEEKPAPAPTCCALCCGPIVEGQMAETYAGGVAHSACLDQRGR